MNTTAKKKKATSTKKRKSIHDTQYGKNVLAVHAGIKKEFNSTGGAIRFVLCLGKDVTPKKYLSALRKIQKDNNLYKAFDEVVRTTKSGKRVKATPFRVLQTLYGQIDKK